ncbi:MAG: PIN domain-containing protein [Turneriella sp.]
MVVIDTSAWIEALRDGGKEDVKKKIARLMEDDEARFCDPILLELRISSPRGAEKSKFDAMLALVPSFPATATAWILAGKYAEKLRSRGISVPAMDFLIRAIADENGAECYSLDADFSLIEKVLTAAR